MPKSITAQYLVSLPSAQNESVRNSSFEYGMLTLENLRNKADVVRRRSSEFPSKPAGERDWMATDFSACKGSFRLPNVIRQKHVVRLPSAPSERVIIV